jgi:hypothetical protein
MRGEFVAGGRPTSAVTLAIGAAVEDAIRMHDLAKAMRQERAKVQKIKKQNADAGIEVGPKTGLGGRGGRGEAEG